MAHALNMPVRGQFLARIDRLERGINECAEASAVNHVGDPAFKARLTEIMARLPAIEARLIAITAGLTPARLPAVRVKMLAFAPRLLAHCCLIFRSSRGVKRRTICNSSASTGGFHRVAVP
jgi:hypothetical protein